MYDFECVCVYVKIFHLVFYYIVFFDGMWRESLKKRYLKVKQNNVLL